MGKRKGRKRQTGRKVYYGRWSNPQLSSMDRAERRKYAAAIDYGNGRYFSPASQQARLDREAKSQDRVINTLGLNRGADNAPRELVLDKLSRFVKLDGLDQHMVVLNKQGLVRILFHNKGMTEYWFVESDQLTGTLRKSITYGSREQAFIFHETNHIRYILTE